MNKIDDIFTAVEQLPVRRIAIAVGQDSYIVTAAAEAYKRNIAESVLVGDKEDILRIAERNRVHIPEAGIVHEKEPLDAAAEAVRLVADGKADILMKGHIHTDDFLRAVLHREKGLRTGEIMSHVFLLEIPGRDRLLFVTDAAMNIAPTMEQKAAILMNSVFLARLFGFDTPKVAVLAASELVNPAMPATLDAAALSVMAERYQFSPAATVQGPFGLDNAVSEIAAEHKNIRGTVAGNADILLVPDIEAGNILVKSLVFLGGARAIGLLVGAKAPVVLTSRADTMETKLLSMAGAALMVNQQKITRMKIGKVHF